MIPSGRREAKEASKVKLYLLTLIFGVFCLNQILTIKSATYKPYFMSTISGRT